MNNSTHVKEIFIDKFVIAIFTVLTKLTKTCMYIHKLVMCS